MTKNRLEAFSDGVIAIIITIMVLELKVPAGHDFSALSGKIPVFLSYVLSFIFVAIYWNNHHHLMHSVHRVTGGVLWANMHLLFWLSLTPFVTGWMGESHLASAPVVLYGAVMLLSGVAYNILVRVLIAVHGRDSMLAKAMGRDRKGLVSLVLYAAAIPLAFIEPRGACLVFAAVALMWLVPDSRIERTLHADAKSS